MLYHQSNRLYQYLKRSKVTENNYILIIISIIDVTKIKSKFFPCISYSCGYTVFHIYSAINYWYIFKF